MTATERLIRPSLTQLAQDRGVTAFSMNNEDVYGPVFHRLTFGQAIEEKIIFDYKIIFSGITSNKLSSFISSNSYLTDGISSNEKTESSQNLYKRLILKKVMNDVGIKKVITFHSKISESKSFAINLTDEIQSSDGMSVNISHINGAMSSQDLLTQIFHGYFNNAKNFVLIKQM